MTSPSEEKAKTVFVVHGRNKKARDSMFTFLRCFGLRPLEWEQARSLTGLSSPSTIDVVKAGIAASQCVLVLFTGDDEARLRPGYGAEPLTPQPRPNVLFEAGWGMATAGRKSSILVRLGVVREISDLSGLNEIRLTNLPDSRKALCDRLRDAGCLLDEKVSDFLSAESGGNFDPEYLDPRGPETTDIGLETDRGTFTSFVVDSALLYRVKSLDLWRNLSANINLGSRIDLKYHYIGASCAAYWLALAGHPDYGHDRILRTIETHSAEMFEILKEDLGKEPREIDLISLGPGDGKIDSRLLFRMAENGINAPYYYCIDISFELLQQAISQILDAPFLNTEHMKVKAIYGDFTELKRLAPIYQWDPTANLFALLGNTMGNYNESTLLQGIRAGMNNGDYLLLDARLHGLADIGDSLTSQQEHAISMDYRHPQNNLFAFGPVEMATIASSADVDYGYEVNRRLTDVPGAFNIITFCRNLKTRLRGQTKLVSRNRLDLAATTQYSFEDLENWLVARGFRPSLEQQEQDWGQWIVSSQEGELSYFSSLH